MRIIISISVLLAIVFFSVGCKESDNVPGPIRPISNIFSYDFTASQDGWVGGFADHFDTTSTDFNLVFARTNLPAPLNTSKKALKLAGTNRSDDLFMFLKRKITGLNPNTNYEIKFEVEFASNVPTNKVGVGGSPDAVMLKAGATLVEPISSLTSDGHYRMNIDHGSQMQQGIDMKNLGTIGVSDNVTEYTLLTKNNSSQLFTLRTNASGEVWVIIGTDSGFESRTELYYAKITVTFY
jgi:hypothetical protein